MDPRNISKTKVVKLREELKARSLSPSGLKATLVRRLLIALKNEGWDVQEQLNALDKEEKEVSFETPAYYGYWTKLASVNGLTNALGSRVVVLSNRPTTSQLTIQPSPQLLIIGCDKISSMENAIGTYRISEIAWHGDTLPKGLQGFTAVLIGNSVVVFGGSVTHSDGSKTCYNDVYELDLSSFIWKKHQIASDPQPRPRDGHTATSVMVGGVPQMFIFGGCAADGRCLNDAYLLNTKTWTWTSVAPPSSEESVIPSPRRGHSATLKEDTRCVYVFGGETVEADGSVRWLSDLYSFQLDSLTWVKIETKGRRQQGRAYHTADIVQSKLFVYGGYNKDYTSIEVPDYVEYLEIDCKKWRRMPIASKIPCGRVFHHSWVSGGLLFVAGGMVLDPHTSNFVQSNCIYVLHTEFSPFLQPHTSTLADDLKLLLMKEEFSDINFRVQNKYCRAHKAVLVTKSEPLRDLCNKKKKRGQTLTMESVKYQPFALFLELLYAGRARIDSPAMVKEVLELAQQYKVEHKYRKLHNSSSYCFYLPTVSLSGLLFNRLSAHDTVVRIGSAGTPFQAHKAVLSARSGLFKECMNGDNEDTGTSDNNAQQSLAEDAPAAPASGANANAGSASNAVNNSTPLLSDEIQHLASIDLVQSGEEMVISMPNMQVEIFTIVLEVIYDGDRAIRILSQLAEDKNWRVVFNLLKAAQAVRLLDLKLASERVICERLLNESTAKELFVLGCITEALNLKNCCAALFVDKLESSYQTETLANGHKEDILSYLPQFVKLVAGDIHPSAAQELEEIMRDMVNSRNHARAHGCEIPSQRPSWFGDVHSRQETFVELADDKNTEETKSTETTTAVNT